MKLQVEPRVPSGAEEGEFKPDATLAPFRKIYNGALCDCDAQDVSCIPVHPLPTDGRLASSPLLDACFCLSDPCRSPAAERMH